MPFCSMEIDFVGRIITLTGVKPPSPRVQNFLEIPEIKESGPTISGILKLLPKLYPKALAETNTLFQSPGYTGLVGKSHRDLKGS